MDINIYLLLLSYNKIIFIQQIFFKLNDVLDFYLNKYEAKIKKKRRKILSVYLFISLDKQKNANDVNLIKYHFNFVSIFLIYGPICWKKDIRALAFYLNII